MYVQAMATATKQRLATATLTSPEGTPQLADPASGACPRAKRYSSEGSTRREGGRKILETALFCYAI